MIRRLVGEHIDVAVRLDAGGRVRADAVQLEQVIVNLVVNARDAMPDGGRLTVETADVGRGVRLVIADTGCGMTADVLAHVFEPFFTTKRTGEGTGLGLATVYGIVTQSDGEIAVESAPGRGTRFTIHLPRVNEAAPGPAAAAVAAPPTRGVETILLVEDEPGVRDFAREVLESYGYTVLPAANADHAEVVVAGHAGPIDLLVSDVIMPGASGPELAERLVAARPGLKVLFVSGYTADAVLRRGVAEPGQHVLAKPFSPQALARKVREILDGA
jgi:CheY-like chemotaxis protein